MTAPRHVDLSAPLCSSRNTVNQAQQSSVDAILKELKTCSRRLQAAFASFQVELQVLEKLHYKGANQHRTALFWRRVADVRRYARRLVSLELHEQLETLRLSFWGEPSQRSAKSLKSAWTHVPDAKSVSCILERLRCSLVLIDKAEEHFRKAHDHFNLDLQTGAFLQLILTLTAITSRMAFLLTEIGPVVAQAWNACYRSLETLDLGRTSFQPRHLAGRYRASDPRNASGSKVMQRSRSQTHQEIEDDVGASVPVSRITMSAAVEAETPKAEQQEADEDTVVVTEDLGLMFTKVETQSTSATIVRSTVQRSGSTTTKQVQESTRKRTATAVQDSKQSGQTKKKRKKKDEIDDIFGF